MQAELEYRQIVEPTLLEKSRSGRRGYTLPAMDVETFPLESFVPASLLRSEAPALPELSENEVVRHFVRLSILNHHVDKGFYPLGSCTMKYNPKVNEQAAALPGFLTLHPLTPARLVQGALQLMYELQQALAEITGLPGVSLQPAAGAHGELTGILMFRAYHRDRGESHRNVILIPDSAHGTNPATAALSGFRVVSVLSNEFGRVDLEDLRQKLDENVAGMMLTNPNTAGIFEREVYQIQQLLHEKGALFYMDGANLNALVGQAKPAAFGVDCIHINLHKTFSTPHGGGGPGSGPVCVRAELEPYLPVPRIEQTSEGMYQFNWDYPKSIGKIHSFWGNFGMMVRAYAYIMLMGNEGLKEISRGAVLNANYLFAKLRHLFQVPFDEQPMHEFVISGSNLKSYGVKTLDVAKRLLDFGFHAPTIYFPLIVPEAMLVEPTESETAETLEAFAQAMEQIVHEAQQEPEKLKNAPYTTPVRRLNEGLASRKLIVQQ